MADLIDRQKIKARFESWLKVKGYSEGELNMLKAVLYEITVMPSADAVDVVRCKDCRYFNKAFPLIHLCNVSGMKMDADDYCSYGSK